MADAAQLENRLDKLEEKLKVTFNLIDKKLNDTQRQPPREIQVKSTAGVQPHKIAEIDERFGRLEEKLKLTFNEIEKRLAQTQQQPHYSVEDRIEELEDLLLLLQLENTKVREKIVEGLDFGIVPAAPDISERITRIESELATHASTTVPMGTDLDSRIAMLEDKINSMGKPVVQAITDDSLKEAIQELEKKVSTLEALLAQRGREQLEEDDLLADVQSILGRR